MIARSIFLTWRALKEGHNRLLNFFLTSKGNFTNLFLLTVPDTPNRMADMTLIKLQGQDGRIEPISSVPPGRDRIDALRYALQNVVALGATEMYATMYKNRTVTDAWADHVPLYYITTR